MFQLPVALALTLISTLLGPSPIDTPAPRISEFTCTQPAWIPNPGMQNGHFVGTLSSVCSVKAENGGGYASLEKYIVEKLKQSATINQGPVSEIYREFPSTYYNVTLQLGNGGDSISMDQDMHVATDYATGLIYDAFSTRVAGTGNAKYIRKLDFATEVRNSGDAGYYSVHFMLGAKVEKPWFIPEGTFVSQVKGSLVNQFVTERDKTAPRFAANL